MCLTCSYWKRYIIFVHIIERFASRCGRYLQIHDTQIHCGIQPRPAPREPWHLIFGHFWRYDAGSLHFRPIERLGKRRIVREYWAEKNLDLQVTLYSARESHFSITALTQPKIEIRLQDLFRLKWSMLTFTDRCAEARGAFNADLENTAPPVATLRVPRNTFCDGVAREGTHRPPKPRTHI